jgi:MSHA biogenesis protein MshM
LGIAGYKGGKLFEVSAMGSLFKASRGIPRLINILSHKSMMSAYGQGAKYIDNKNVKAAIKDTEDAQLSRSKNKSIWYVSGFILLSLIVLAILLLN